MSNVQEWTVCKDQLMWTKNKRFHQLGKLMCGLQHIKVLHTCEALLSAKRGQTGVAYAVWAILFSLWIEKKHVWFKLMERCHINNRSESLVYSCWWKNDECIKMQRLRSKVWGRYTIVTQTQHPVLSELKAIGFYFTLPPTRKTYFYDLSLKQGGKKDLIGCYWLKNAV